MLLAAIPNDRLPRIALACFALAILIKPLPVSR